MSTLLQKEDRRERVIHLFQSIIGSLDKERNIDKLLEYVGELHYVFQLMYNDDLEFYSRKFPKFGSAVTAIELDSTRLLERADGADDDNQLERIVREYKETTTRNAQTAIDVLEKIPAIRDTKSFSKVSRQPFSYPDDPPEKRRLPPELIDKILENVSGKKGPSGTHLSQLAMNVGRSGVSSNARNGGKKTKRNHRRSKKTRSRK